MVAAEFKNAVSTIRIHDECFEAAADRCISHLNQIISSSYRRRQLPAEERPQSIAAAQMAGDPAEA